MRISGPFGRIQLVLQGSFPAVGRIQLVGPLIQEVGSGGLSAADGLSKRSVISGGKFCRISEDRGMGMTGVIQSIANSPDPPVHHIGRSHEIDPGFSLLLGHLAKDADGGVI